MALNLPEDQRDANIRDILPLLYRFNDEQLAMLEQDYNKLENKTDLNAVKLFITTWKMKGRAEKKDDKKEPPSGTSSVITLTEQIDPISLVRIRRCLEKIPTEIRDEVNRAVGKSFSKVKANGEMLNLSDIERMITKTAREIQLKAKAIERKVEKVASETESSPAFSP